MPSAPLAPPRHARSATAESRIDFRHLISVISRGMSCCGGMLRRPHKFRLPNHRRGRILTPIKKLGGSVMTSRLALCATVAATVFFDFPGAASAQTYEVTKLVPGSAFHGVHGLGIDKAGHLFAGSVAGAALYEVDRDNGTAKIAIPSPEGMADDIAFAPDGTMA